MKRRDLVRHLEQHERTIVREGKRTTRGDRRAAVPHHTEITNVTSARICADLGISATAEEAGATAPAAIRL